MPATKKIIEEEAPPEFDWIALRKDMDKIMPTETAKEKFVRKMNENPFVPFGCLATATALTLGLRSFQKGDSKLSQKMMRLRIAAQGFTVAALVGGIFVSNMGSNGLDVFKKKED